MVDKLTGLLTRDRTAVYPWFVLVGLVAAWLVSVSLGPGWTDLGGNVVGNDFVAFYAASGLIAESPAVDLYDIAVLHERQHRLIPEMSDAYQVPYLNPPVALLWYAPLRVFPYGGALLAWWTLGALAWIGAHRALLATSPALGGWGLGRLLLGSLLFPPTVMVVIYGQATGFLLLLLAGCYALLVGRRELAAGVVLGLLAFKPQVALGLALPLIAARRGWALLGGALSVAAQVALAYWLWPAQFAHFFAARGLITSLVVHPDYNTWAVHSSYGFWHLLVGGLHAGLADAANLVTSLLLVGWLVAVWWRAPWSPDQAGWRRRVAGTLVLALLLGLQLFTYDLALLMLPFWLMVGVIDARPGTNPALDAGPVLRASALVFVLAFFGPYLTKAMADLSQAQLGVRVALQLTTPALLGIGVWLVHSARAADATR